VRFAKRKLIRYAKEHGLEGKDIYVQDSKQILPGRGIYLCNDEACIERGHKKLGIAAKN